jgi:hypothetical protein
VDDLWGTLTKSKTLFVNNIVIYFSIDPFFVKVFKAIAPGCARAWGRRRRRGEEEELAI